MYDDTEDTWVKVIPKYFVPSICTGVISRYYFSETNYAFKCQLITTGHVTGEADCKQSYFGGCSGLSTHLRKYGTRCDPERSCHERRNIPFIAESPSCDRQCQRTSDDAERQVSRLLPRVFIEKRDRLLFFVWQPTSFDAKILLHLRARCDWHGSGGGGRGD